MNESPPASTSTPRRAGAVPFLLSALSQRTATILLGVSVTFGVITGCQATGDTLTAAHPPARATTTTTSTSTSTAGTSSTSGPTASSRLPAVTTPPTAPATTPAASPTVVSSAPPQPTSSTTVASGRITGGVTYSGKGTWYTADNPTGNCLYDNALQDPSGAFAAMNETDYETARMCGAYIEATGPKGTTRVKIVNRCPLPCAPGQIDFSKQAFTQIAGDPQLGEVPISWHLVSPANIGNIQYVVRDGSSEWYLAIQPRNHRNPVASLEISVNGKWQVLERQMWNYFLPNPAGLGKGPFTIRLTDIYGEQLISSGITLTPGTVQSTSTQFTQH